jgi:hypothetical protein
MSLIVSLPFHCHADQTHKKNTNQEIHPLTREIAKNSHKPHGADKPKPDMERFRQILHK